MIIDNSFMKAVDTYINPLLLNIGVITSVNYSRRKIAFELFLNGIEDKKIEVICNKISISDDYRSITFSDFSSNMPFAENALNMFAARTYKLPESKSIKTSLRIVKAILDL